MRGIAVKALRADVCQLLDLFVADMFSSTLRFPWVLFQTYDINRTSEPPVILRINLLFYF